ncbi:hypothetical protein BT96DRAFT_924449 [Gymnopus androsaceus JB14]|uniref:F-box domain-containing protein n=1 Tax=Gymnopus androsaceus JB14 TaxID=1447944 RepID=A0A6A4H3Y4_9AGAR|nr:hypothetical protein BT96DRAFT_924449 [Gymnopus androsaceus JB14]
MVKPIPNELVESILDHLHSDKGTLLNCALVGRAWVHSSQQGIFREIVLDLPLPHISITDYTTQIENFLKTTEWLISSFDTSPRLASYVRSLLLVKFRKFPEAAVSYQEAVYTATANIVRRLSNVGVDKVLLLVQWNDLSHSLKTALTDMLRAPQASVTQLSLVQFVISTFAEVAALLSHMPHLKMLRIGLFCANWDVPNSSLESAMTGTVGCPPRSIQLEKLQFDSEQELTSFASWFQQDCCPFSVQNLQELELFHYVGGSNNSVFHLGYTPNIHSLRLVIWQGGMNSDTPVPWIQSLFTPLLDLDSRDNTISLRRLIIDLNQPHTQWNNEWALLDALLAKSEFVQLETVQFNLLASYYVSWESLKEKLPLLDGSGKLKVSGRAKRVIIRSG